MARFQSDLFRKNLTSDPRFDPMSDHGGEAPKDYFAEPLSEEERARIFDEPTDRSVEKDEYKVEAIPETPAAAIPSVAAPKPAAAPQSVSVPKMTQPVLPAAVEEEPEAEDPAKEDKLPAVPSEFTKEALTQAIAERRGLRGAKAISEAGAGIGAAIAGLGAGAVVKPGGNFDFLEKEAGEKVSDLTTKQKQVELMESRDPKSAQSKMARDFFASVNPALKDQIQGMSHAQLKEAAPWVMKKFEKEMAADLAKAKMAEARARAAESAGLRKENLEDRMNRKASTEVNEIVNKANAALANPNTSYGRDAKILNLADRIKIAVDSWDDRNKIPDFVANEIATGMASLFSQNTTVAESMVERFIPENANRTLAGWKQWWSSHPTPAKQKEFIDTYMKTLNNESLGAQKRIEKTQAIIAKGGAIAKQYKPRALNAGLLQAGVRPEHIENADPDPEASKLFDIIKATARDRHTNPKHEKAYDIAHKKLKELYGVFD
jgi:hypothetical protein